MLKRNLHRSISTCR